jgi:hypothetical protein
VAHVRPGRGDQATVGMAALLITHTGLLRLGRAVVCRCETINTNPAVQRFLRYRPERNRELERNHGAVAGSDMSH